MQSDNDTSTAMIDLPEENMGEQEDPTVQWLLEQDYSDPAEKLFTVSGQDVKTDVGLSEYEAEIANRPMFGGEGSSDDLSCFVSEEIVMSESGADIFGGSGSPGEVTQGAGTAASGFSMALDRSNTSGGDVPSAGGYIEEGVDILGLDENDDIGERHVVMQKNPAKKRKNTLSAVKSTVAPKEKAAAPVLLESVEAEVAPETLELEVPSAEPSLELSAGDLSDAVPELEIENLPMPEIVKDDEQPPVQELSGLLSDFAAPQLANDSSDTESEPLEVDANIIGLATETVLDDIAAFSIAPDGVLELDGIIDEGNKSAEDDQSSGFLSAQALNLSDDISTETEAPSQEEPMSFDLSLAEIEPEATELDVLEPEQAEDLEISLATQPTEAIIELESELEPEHLDIPGVELSAESTEDVAEEITLDQGALDVAEPLGDAVEAAEDSENENVSNLGIVNYVTTNEPPTDDAEFDQYLLAGEHLEDPELSLDGLVVDSTEGIVSVDTQLETVIDYHEDFSAQVGLDSDFVDAITGAIGPVMEELSGCVEARLSSLSIAPESVQAELMLGTDEASIKQCQDEDYRPILELVTTKIESLSRLGQEEIDSIYVRLSSVCDDSNWNELFAEDFEKPAAHTDEIDAQDGDVISDGEDFLGDDLAFTDSVDALDVLASGNLPEFAQELSAESLFDEATLSEDPVAESDSPDVAVTLDSVFDEDIFSADLTEEFAPIDTSTGVDVEALIHSLADVESDIGEICGVSVDQFASTEAANSPDLATTNAPAENPVATTTAGSTVESELSWCVPADIEFSYTSASNTEIFSEFLDAFIEEGASELEKLEDALGEWEKDISNESAYSPIPRILHTLKGIAKGVGLQRYGTLIHNFETLLDGLERPDVGQQAGYFRIVNGWLDASAKGFEHIESERTDIASELPAQTSAPVLDKVKETEPKPELPVSVQALPDQSSSSASTSKIADDNSKDKQLADEGAKVLAAQQTIRMTPEALDRLLSLTNEAQQLGVRSSQATVRSKRSAAELLTRLSSVRAHVSKIAERTLLNVTAKGGQASSEMDALEMDQYSELQEAANFLREGVEDLDDLIHLSSRQNTVAEALLKQQASIISSLGSSIQSARVIPVSRLMPGLRRIVRTVSADLGKSVSFRVLNEVGTLDRDNHARCQIILEHMTRNALDHGIETPDVRAAAGKDTTGSITIEASKLGSDYIVTLSDDGKGIDPEFMRDMAYEKGLDIDVDKLSDEEAIRLIFHKGFSTSTVVSEISGRGVGMDIVLSELQHIGGDIEIESTVGVGTTFKVRIPSNVTVNGALLVAAGEVSYAIPLDGLIAVEHVPVDVFYDAIRDKTQLTLFGMDCDPAYLATICHGDTLPDRTAWNTTVPVIIAGSERHYMAIAIDDVTQALELVIRSLGAQFSMIPGLAGGATTADGKSIVALDLNALVESTSADTLSPVSMRTESEERMLVLVVDDSRTQRMVATSQFDNLGVETVTAENGLVAIDLLNTTHRLPDVILLDIEMPVKDGIQTLREIRKSTRYSDLPVIMVTSRTGAKHRALAEEAGCNGYMGKPFNFPKLVEQIADLTNHKFQLS